MPKVFLLYNFACRSNAIVPNWLANKTVKIYYKLSESWLFFHYFIHNRFRSSKFRDISFKDSSDLTLKLRYELNVIIALEKHY